MLVRACMRCVVARHHVHERERTRHRVWPTAPRRRMKMRMTTTTTMMTMTMQERGECCALVMWVHHCAARVRVDDAYACSNARVDCAARLQRYAAE